MAKSRWAELRRRSPAAVDGLLAVAIATAQLAGAAADARQAGEPQLTMAAALILVASAVPLIWRRRSPVVVLASVGIVTGLYGIREYPDPLLAVPLLVALYTVAAGCGRRTTVIVAAISAVIGATSLVISGDSGAVDYYGTFSTAILALVLGDRQRLRAWHLSAVEGQAGELRRRLAAESERSAAQERSSIAREMHDVVAHHVSMVVVQAEAGAAVSDADAAARFDAIAATGRSALVELRRVLGVLRSHEDDSIAPQPGIDRIGSLVQQVRATGMFVELVETGERPPMPPGVDLAAYRVVQEGLTNAARHARGAATMVSLQYRAGGVDIEIADSGTDPAEDCATGPALDGGLVTPGRGLAGIRERATMCGGTMSAGPTPTGGYVLKVELPLAPEPTASELTSS